MTTDAHGNPTTGSTNAIERFDATLDRLLRYDAAVLDLWGALAADEPDLPMGQAMTAYLMLSATDAPYLPPAREAAAKLRQLPLNARETAHADAIDSWLAGDWRGAAARLDTLLVQWPADLLALQVGHQLDFFLGDAQNLRDRVGRSLGSIDPKHPHYALALGMHAFGLEESGHYSQSEAAGLAAVETNPDDVWAIHAVVHTYEMQGRVDDGIAFLRQREADWGDGNLFKVHNWWHLALYQLEAGQPDGAIAIYDQHLHNADSEGVPLEMLDASALLWRLLLDGVDTGDRFVGLANAWATRVDNEPWYAFNDVHAVMALCGAGRVGDAHAVIERLGRYVGGATESAATNVAMTGEIGLPACRAVVAFTEERHGDVITELLPIRGALQHFGGSHAQRDALQRTLLTSALRGGEFGLARALVSERLALRENSVYAWLRRADLLDATGDTVAGAEARSRAGSFQARFAAALA